MRLLLVDGHYYLYRSFFAIRGLTNARGEPTNAIYGFCKAVRKMVADIRPDLGAVIWDAGLPEQNEAGDLLRIAKYYDWSKNYKAAIIYYNDIVRKQPKTADADFSKTRIEELRGQVGDDALRVGSENAESGEKLALRRRLQAQVETSSLSDYAGPSRRDIVPDELPIVKQPRLRTDSRDVQPLPAPVEPLLPTQ